MPHPPHPFHTAGIYVLRGALTLYLLVYLRPAIAPNSAGIGPSSPANLMRIMKMNRRRHLLPFPTSSASFHSSIFAHRLLDTVAIFDEGKASAKKNKSGKAPPGTNALFTRRSQQSPLATSILVYLARMCVCVCAVIRSPWQPAGCPDDFPMPLFCLGRRACCFFSPHLCSSRPEMSL